VFSVTRSSVPLTRLSHTDDVSDVSMTTAVDQISQQPADNSTDASSDVDILPKKFLNRNPRYIYGLVLALQTTSSVNLLMFGGAYYTRSYFQLGSYFSACCY